MDMQDVIRDIKNTWGKALSEDELQDAILYTLERAGAIAPNLSMELREAVGEVYLACC